MFIFPKFYNSKIKEKIMENSIKYRGYEKMKLCRVCFFKKYKKNHNKELLGVLPNFLIKDNIISIDESRPQINHKLNKSLIIRETKYEEKISIVNDIIRNKSKSFGVFVCIRSDFSEAKSSFIIAEINGRLFGITCLHVILGFSPKNTKFYVSFEERPDLDYINNKDESFFEVTIPPHYLKCREELLRKYEEAESHVFHDPQFNMHPLPTFDLLLFILPDNLEKGLKVSNNYFKLEDNKDWWLKESFIFFVGYHLVNQGELINLNNAEYQFTIKNKGMKIYPKNLVFINRKTLTFGEIITFNYNNLGTGKFTTLPGVSGSGIINSNGNLVGIIGLSYDDYQRGTQAGN